MKITPKILNELYELDEKYKINSYYEKAEGNTPQEKYTSMFLNFGYMNAKEKAKIMEYYYTYYSKIKNIDYEKACEVDYKEVKNDVNTFRLQY